jgi:hypothetical protein
MKTRNQIKQEEQAMVAQFTHQFFEESSKAWLSNKEKYGQNMYRYRREAFLEPLEVNKPEVRRSKRLLEKAKETRE